ALRDDKARSFAIGFYGGLGERESIAAAYKQGCAAISLEGLRDRDRPQLAVRPGVDASKLILAANPAEPRARRASAGTASASQPGRPSASTAAPPTVDIGIHADRELLAAWLHHGELAHAQIPVLELRWKAPPDQPAQHQTHPEARRQPIDDVFVPLYVQS